jgi:hypothetical protein
MIRPYRRVAVPGVEQTFALLQAPADDHQPMLRTHQKVEWPGSVILRVPVNELHPLGNGRELEKHGVNGGGEDPWRCGPGFRRVCLCRGMAATSYRSVPGMSIRRAVRRETVYATARTRDAVTAARSPASAQCNPPPSISLVEFGKRSNEHCNEHCNDQSMGDPDRSTQHSPERNPRPTRGPLAGDPQPALDNGDNRYA